MEEELNNTLSAIDPKFSQFLYESILAVTQKDDWAREALTSALKMGLQFSIRTYNGLGAYLSVKKILVFNMYLAEKALQNNALEKSGFNSVLKHELTHAYDLKTTDIYEQSDISFLSYYEDIANEFLNLVHLIRQGSRINAEIFSKFLPIIPSDTEPAKHFIHTSGSEFIINRRTPITLKETIDWNLSFLGCYPGKIDLNFTLYITESNQHNRLHFLFFGTTNPFAAHQLVRLRSNSITKTLMAGVLEDHNDTILYNAFSRLSPQLQNLLDILLIFEYRLSQSVNEDKYCYPLFLECLQKLELDCLEVFLDCQKNKDFSSYKISVLEIHAVLRERFSIQNLPANYSLSEICEPRPHNKPAVNTHTSTRGALSCFTFGFYSALVDAVLDTLQLSRWNKFFLKPILQAGFFYMLGAELGEAALFICLGYILNLASEYLNLGKISFRGTSVNIVDALMLLPQFSSISSVKTLATTLAGNAAGSYGTSFFKPAHDPATQIASKSTLGYSKK